MFVLCGADSAYSAIIPGGDVTPVYDGVSDPWAVPGGALTVGDTGLGFLVADSGSDISSTFTVLGNLVGSDGSLAVVDAGSTHTSTVLGVGIEGLGFLDVDSGGVVDSAVGFLGSAVTATGTATIDGFGSLWDIESDLVVGGGVNIFTGVVSPGGGGTLDVVNGGAVAVGDAAVPNGQGVFISDADLVGGAGGNVFVFANDAATVEGDTVLGQSANQIGRVTLSGTDAKWENSFGDVIIGDGGVYASITDALPQDLITELSRLRWLFVIARGSSFRFRDQEPDFIEIGQRLGARYCVAGGVEILDYVVAEDCGVVINPMIVEGQIAGGVVQGIAGALLERFDYDENGTPRTAGLADYLVPSAAEMPSFVYDHIETPSDTEGGFKGMGEGGAIAAPAAVANAVCDALGHCGDTELPMSPEVVWRYATRREGS